MKPSVFSLFTAIFTASLAPSFAPPVSAQSDAIRLVADLTLDSTPLTVDYQGDSVVAADSQAFFFARDEEVGTSLWRTDGSDEGTYPLLEICPYACLTPFGFYGTVGDRAFFSLANQVWQSDGTPEGTRLVFRSPPVSLSGGASTKTHLVMKAQSPAPSELGGLEWLWATDGTRSGSIPIPLPDQPIGFGATGDQVLVVTSSDLGTNRLWRTDGTLAGTLKVSDLCTECSFSFGSMTELDDRVVFATYQTSDPNGIMLTLWTSDGTEAGTQALGTFEERSSGTRIRPFQGKAYGLALQEGRHVPWVSDGTPSGTRLAPELLPAPVAEGNAQSLVATEEALYAVIAPPNTARRRQLWALAGPEGPQLIGEDELIQALDVTGSTALFFSQGPAFTTPENPPTYWTTLGTRASTRPAPLKVAHYVAFDDRLLLTGLVENPHPGTMWRQPVDLSTEPTVLPMEILDSSSTPQALTPWQDRLALTTRAPDDPATGTLWVIDDNGAQELQKGSVGPLNVAGTKLFQVDPEGRGLNAYGQDLSSTFVDLGEVATAMDNLGDRLFVYADRGQQVWVTQGDSESTQRLAGVHPGFDPEGPCAGEFTPARELIALDDQVLFTAFQRCEGPGELWSTDGTVATTGQVETFPGEFPNQIPLPFQLKASGSGAFFTLPDSDRGFHLRWIDGATQQSERLTYSLPVGLLEPRGKSVFFTADNGFLEELWYLSEPGAEPVRLHSLGTQSSTVHEMVVSDDLLFLAATADAGRELWVSDGSTEGTRMIDIFPGKNGSHVTGLTPIPGGVFFSANDGTGVGHEPWVSAGTAQTTGRVADLLPGHESSFPGPAVRMGNTLYFSARGADIGRELFALDLDRLRFGNCPADSLCLLNQRFRVRMQWRTDNASGAAQNVSATDSSGLFSFFQRDNWEAMVKVLDGCDINGHFWVFAAASTDLGYTLTVEDTQTGERRTYTNPTGIAAPAINDIEAFTGCSSTLTSEGLGRRDGLTSNDSQ